MRIIYTVHIEVDHFATSEFSQVILLLLQVPELGGGGGWLAM